MGREERLGEKGGGIGEIESGNETMNRILMLSQGVGRSTRDLITKSSMFRFSERFDVADESLTTTDSTMFECAHDRVRRRVLVAVSG